jgi:hypothetical protein
VIGVRGRDVDHVHVQIVGKLLIRRVARRHTELVAKGIGGGLRPRTDRDQFGAGRRRQPAGKVMRDLAGADDAPPHRALRSSQGVYVVSHVVPSSFPHSPSGAAPRLRLSAVFHMVADCTGSD